MYNVHNAWAFPSLPNYDPSPPMVLGAENYNQHFHTPAVSDQSDLIQGDLFLFNEIWGRLERNDKDFRRNFSIQRSIRKFQRILYL